MNCSLPTKCVVSFLFWVTICVLVHCLIWLKIYIGRAIFCLYCMLTLAVYTTLFKTYFLIYRWWSFFFKVSHRKRRKVDFRYIIFLQLKLYLLLSSGTKNAICNLACHRAYPIPFIFNIFLHILYFLEWQSLLKTDTIPTNCIVTFQLKSVVWLALLISSAEYY